MYCCFLCENYFDSSENFQNHNLKEHFEFKSIKTKCENDLETVQICTLNTETTKDKKLSSLNQEIKFDKIIEEKLCIKIEDNLNRGCNAKNVEFNSNEKSNIKLYSPQSSTLDSHIEETKKLKNIEFNIICDKKLDIQEKLHIKTENYFIHNGSKFESLFSFQQNSLLPKPNTDLKGIQSKKNDIIENHALLDQLENSNTSEKNVFLSMLPFSLNDIDEVNKKCKYCKKQFSKTVNLIEHTKNHLNFILTCNICGRHSTRIGHAQTHKRSHQKIKCNLCDVKLSNENALDKHLKRHEMLKCKYCSKIFKKFDAIQNHLRTHTGEKPYKCESCKSAFALKKNLQTHVITQHTENIVYFFCKFCNKKFKTKQLHNWHTKRIHLKEKPHQCELCGLNFANMSGLRRHKLKDHTDYSQRPYHCVLCDKKYVEFRNLTEHMNKHTGEKPFKCDICTKAFRQKSALREHKKLHTGIKTYLCNICGKAFAQHSGLANHTKQHHI